MNLRHISVIILGSIGSLLPLRAQELKGDVTVNAEYLPTLRSHSRISPLPTAPRLSLPESSLNLSFEGVPAFLQPSLAPMSATPWRASKEFSRYRGYLELEGGSYLDFNGSAGYRLIDSEKATLGVWLQHLSSTGFRPESVIADTKAFPAKRFDETIGLYGSYDFAGIGILDFDLAYHLGYFNYYSSLYPDVESGSQPPTQTLNDFSARVGLRSRSVSEGFSWKASLYDRYFGYRRFYSREADFTPSRENRIGLEGCAAYAFTSSVNVDLGLSGGYVGYTKAHNAPEFWEINGVDYNPSLSGYGYLALTPAFNYSDGDFSARLGVRFDINSKIGKQENSYITVKDKFGNFHAAPDLLFSYRKGLFAAELGATGGVELRTLAAGAELFYYQSPQLFTTLPLFSPVNASLNLNFGSFYGLSARIGVAYKVTENTTPDLLYPQIINGVAPNFYLPGLTTLNVKGFSLGAGLNYKYGDIVTLKGDLSYQPQSGKTGYFNGVDRPRWIINVNADVNPWSTLHVIAGYQYRGVRGIWYEEEIENSGVPGLPASSTNFIRLNDVTDLSIGASYTFREKYTLRLNVSNLLGNHYLLSPYMPSEGLRITGGFAILF